MLRRFSKLWKVRQHRETVLGGADLWNQRARECTGHARSMWPSATLNEVYDAEQRVAIAQNLPDIAGQKILDIGCGTGRMSRFLAARGAAEVVGVDIASEVIEAARRETRDPSVTYRAQSIYDLTDDQHFDGVHCLGAVCVACNSPAQLAQVLERFNAALKPGGWLLLLEPIHTSWFLHRALTMTPDDFADAVAHAGFDVQRTGSMHFWPTRMALAYFSIPMPITRVVAGAGRRALKTLGSPKALGDYMVLFARKNS